MAYFGAGVKRTGVMGLHAVQCRFSASELEVNHRSLGFIPSSLKLR